MNHVRVISSDEESNNEIEETVGDSETQNDQGNEDSDLFTTEELFNPSSIDPSVTPPDPTNLNKFKKDKTKRRNIRKVLSDSKMADETLEAQRKEEQRLRRLADRQKIKTPEPIINNQTQLVDLTLSDTEDDIQMRAPSNKITRFDPPPMPAIRYADRNYTSQYLESRGLNKMHIQTKKKQPRFMEGAFEPDKSHHVTDGNFMDVTGKILINTKHPPEDQDIFVPTHLAHIIKKHQLGGIRFMYDNVVESISNFQKEEGFGCVLAHSMGLGKTLQVICFVDIVMRNVGAKYVLIIVPINTLQNWVQEFDQWLPSDRESEGIERRPFGIYVLNDKYKNKNDRVQLIKRWYETTGVMLMGYEMYRILTKELLSGPERFKQRKTAKQRQKEKEKGPTCVDLEEDDLYNELAEDLRRALIAPGPDIIICDEGHRIKNMQTNTAQALGQIATKRRIVLTGYPLQNNLSEYWCMVNFVRPNHLGSKAEFRQQFENPIVNGLCTDSTPEDRALAKKRSYVLSKKLSGFVQRRNHSHLVGELPKKTEFVVLMGKSEVQRKLYSMFYTHVCPNDDDELDRVNPLTAYAACCKFWNHPDILYDLLLHRDRKAVQDALDDFELADADETPPTKAVKGRRKGRTVDTGKSLTYNWARPIMSHYTPGVMNNGYKFDLAFSIIDQATQIGDKLLLFSQSLTTLDLIEKYLMQSKLKVKYSMIDEIEEMDWQLNKTYYRIDGSTSATERQALIQRFNKRDSQCHLFLISTRAGSLGINLIAANRVIVFDASWNPSHDAQAVCRVYRYGQKKKTYIYRLITDNSMEKVIFNRQIGKQGLADQVVDEMQVQPDLQSDELRRLMQYDPQIDSVPVIWHQKDEFDLEDDVFNSVCKVKGHIIKEMPALHESLLLDEEDLTIEEKEEADREFQSLINRGQNSNINTQSLMNRMYDDIKMPNIPLQIQSTGIFSDNIGMMNQDRVAVVRPIKGAQGHRFAPQNPWFNNAPGPSWEFGAQPQPTSAHANFPYVPPVASLTTNQIMPQSAPYYPPYDPLTPHSTLPAPSQREFVIKHMLAPESAVLPNLTEPGSLYNLQYGQQIALVKIQNRCYLRLPDRTLLLADGTNYERMIIDAVTQPFPTVMLD